MSGVTKAAVGGGRRRSTNQSNQAKLLPCQSVTELKEGERECNERMRCISHMSISHTYSGCVHRHSLSCSKSTASPNARTSVAG